MNRYQDLQELVCQLVEEAYPELKSGSVDAQWGKTPCFATVSWSSSRKTIRITCNTQTQRWHEGALLGLLAHELSHPAQGKHTTSERSTDVDAIERGLGPYLAAERAIAGKFEDHIINHGKDMYLGYRTVRSFLVGLESQQLDALLREMRLIPDMKLGHGLQFHDLIVCHRENQVEFTINGSTFTVFDDIEDPQIDLIARDGATHVYLDGQEIGEHKDFKT